MNDLDELMRWCRLIPVPELERILDIQLEDVTSSPLEQPSEHKRLFDDDGSKD